MGSASFTRPGRSRWAGGWRSRCWPPRCGSTPCNGSVSRPRPRPPPRYEHPNIVPVIAYDHVGDVPYLAMRLIEGRNLAVIVRELRERAGYGVPPCEAAELGLQAAEALDYAHQHDVLHRDIKPSNLLLDDNGLLWLADFGLARVQGSSDLTATGDVIGTLRYLSPEQARGRRGAVDARSDVYALGATLFELLTLRPVFEGDDRAELLVRIASEEPHFSRRLDGAIPFDLRTIVLKALAKDPADRYQTAGELAADLSRFLANLPIRAQLPTLMALGAVGSSAVEGGCHNGSHCGRDIDGPGLR